MMELLLTIDGGLNKVFIIHVQEVLNFCKNEGFFKAYEKSRLHLLDCITRSTNAKDELTDAMDEANTSKDRMKALEKSEELVRTAVLIAAKALPRKGKHFFTLYKMLLGEDARVEWCQIVEAQIGAANWTDLQGNVQEVAREHSIESFRDCVKFHLLP